jgi:hypothetical protein
MQGIHKRLVRFQKLLENLAETALVFDALAAVRFSCLLRDRGTSFQDGVAAGEGCVLRSEVSRSVITAQPEFRARFKKDASHKKKVTFHCNHRSRHLKTEHTESLLLLRHRLGNWSRSPVVG